jgi:hypothetical protein
MKTYTNLLLYKEISTQIKKENYNVIRFQKNDLLAKLQEKYPFVKDITITFITDNAVRVNLIFQEPELIIRNQQQKYGVFRGHTFLLAPEDLLGTGTKILDLP